MTKPTHCSRSTLLRSRPLGALLILGGLAAPGCTGRIGDDSPTSTEPTAAELQCASAEPDVEPTIVRMLNRREYGATVRDLLGVTIDVAADLPADPIVGFDNRAESLVASSLLVEKHFAAAQTLAEAANLGALSPCAEPETCVDAFIASFGRRAFRRPLDADETAALRGIYDRAEAAGRSAEASMRLVIQGALMSPQFLYRAETSVSPQGGVVPAEPFEIASRLSYFLWASMPDDTLLDAAAAGELSSREGVETHARRMLDDPRARDVTRAFHELWWTLYRLPGIAKDSEIFPGYDTIQPLFAEETLMFADHVFWAAPGGAAEYLVSDTGYANDALAAHYALAPPGSSELQEVSLTGTERWGLLTQGSILSIQSNPDRTSPTKRGQFVREQLLCQPPPPPPGDVPPLAPTTSTDGSLRERLAEHVSNPACKGCHQLLDPVGFGLENYDAVGRYRTEEAGAPVDASGELIGVDPGGAFVGVRELSEKLIDTEELYACVATQWFRFAMGREEGKRDDCTVEGVVSDFRASGDAPTELLLTIATSNAFLYKNTEASQ